jgi:hypothetical protein
MEFPEPTTGASKRAKRMRELSLRKRLENIAALQTLTMEKLLLITNY